MANDSFLYTGQSSQTQNLSVSAKKDDSADKEHDRVKLMPAADVVLPLIDREIKKLESHDFVKEEALIHSAQPHSLEVYTLSRKEAIDHMKSLKTAISNALRDNKRSKK